MYKLIRPLIFTQDSERMHSLVLWLGECVFSHTPLRQMTTFLYKYENSVLSQEFLGIRFENPVGIPGGFDKNARMLDFWPALGLGFAEVGSVTAGGGPGNKKPRAWRLPEDVAAIQHMGLPNIGADAVAARMEKRLPKISRIPIGINIAKTHDPKISGQLALEDYCYTLKRLHKFADYLLINVSCPNTEEGKTFEDCVTLNLLLAEIKKVVASENITKPILLKFSPDMDNNELDKILEVTESYNISGYIFTNSSHGMRERLKTPADKLAKIGAGGLSGEPIRQKSTELIRHAYSRLRRPSIIGLGGISSAEDAYEKIKAGASLVQIFNGFIYEGPSLVKDIKVGLVKLLARDGFKNIAEAVGADVK